MAAIVVIIVAFPGFVLFLNADIAAEAETEHRGYVNIGADGRFFLQELLNQRHSNIEISAFKLIADIVDIVFRVKFLRFAGDFR